MSSISTALNGGTAINQPILHGATIFRELLVRFEDNVVSLSTSELLMRLSTHFPRQPICIFLERTIWNDSSVCGYLFAFIYIILLENRNTKITQEKGSCHWVICEFLHVGLRNEFKISLSFVNQSRFFHETSVTHMATNNSPF